MITNPLLEEIYNTQKLLVEDAGYDIRKYSENVHKIVLEIEKEYGITFKYSSRQGRELEPSEQVASI